MLTEAPVSDTMETERFCRMFNTFFDTLNTRSLEESHCKRNENLDAYRSADDNRLKVCAEFLINSITFSLISGLKKTS